MKRIYFDHLPKCGGTTLNRELEQYFNRSQILSIYGKEKVDYYNQVDMFINSSPSEKRNFRFIKGHYTLDIVPFLHPKTFKITILREPIDRIVSHYYFAKRIENHYLYKYINENKITLAEYTKIPITDELTNWYTSHFSKMSLFEINGNQKAATDRAFDFIIKNFDLIGVVEHYNRFLTDFKKMSGLKLSSFIENKNSNPDKYLEYDITDEAYSEISKSNNLDIELYKRVTEYLNLNENK